MKDELLKKGSFKTELTIDVEVIFAYNEDTLFNYYVWLDAGYTNSIDIYTFLTGDQQTDIEEAIEERINEIKNEG